jgi:hypothetical protein
VNTIYSLKLANPYPLNESFKERTIKCIVFGLFVFGFLFVFRPFNINGLKDQLFKIAIGYGVVCSCVMIILNVFLFDTFPNYFNERNWTIKRELIWSIINLVCIAIANFIYSYFIGITILTTGSFFLFLTYTLAIGLFPISAAVLINYTRWNNKYELETEALNPIIEAEIISVISQDIELVRFFAENNALELEILPIHFLYAKADDNYVELYYMQNGIKNRKVLRNSLKKIHAFLPSQQNFYRCHKSYVINLDHVNHISGNAQGYKFHLKSADELIPVSRSNNDFVKNYFTNRPKNTQNDSKDV